MSEVTVYIRKSELDRINEIAESGSVEKLPGVRYLDTTGRYGISYGYVWDLPSDLAYKVEKGEYDEVFEFYPHMLGADLELISPYLFMSVMDLENGELKMVSVISGKYEMETFRTDLFELSVCSTSDDYEYPLDVY